MPRAAASALAALVVTQLGLGWYFGFPPQAGLVFWILAGLAAFPAWRLMRAIFPWNGLADAIVRVALVAFAEIVLVGLLLGSFRLLGSVPYLLAFAGVCVASLGLEQPRGSARVSWPRVPVSIAAVVIPLLAFIVAVGLVQSPLTLYDSVSYHLVFPARWLQEHGLSIVQTPFSDPAQAYQPANGELFFLWLMTPFHGDLLARVGQLPFLALGGVALYAIARQCGARAEHAAYAPLFFFVTRPVVEQAVGADVDLICAATFLTSIYLGIVAVQTDARRDWALWGVSLGLYLGSKYLALVYVIVLLVLPLIRGVRRQALWALPGAALLGLPWYVRNWVAAGSPIYPASLQVLGLTIARGAFAREAMNNSVFHVTDVRLLPAILAHAFGAATFLCWLPLAALASVSILARRQWWPAGYVLLVPIAMAVLCWFGIPDNADSRFLLPAVAVSMVPLTFLFGSDGRRNGVLHALYLTGVVWLLVGTQRQMTMSLPWFMGDWLALDGIVSRASLPLFGVGMVAASIVYAVSRRGPQGVPLLAAAFGAGCMTLAIGAQRSYASDRSSLLALSPTYIRVGMLAGWDWVHHHLEHATIANTGNNVPYPLFDEHLSNRVCYVNIDRHGDWRFHDYARVRGRAGAATIHDLAQPSGQLMPLAGPAGESEASRPRFERQEGHPDGWLRNLREAGVTHLFVSVLSAYEIGYVRHNPEGFPTEDDWARGDPGTFTLLYENGQVRVYSVTRQ
jgi:Dolichyl-phosphate-mannose-protein mannosyltransferase